MLNWSTSLFLLSSLLFLQSCGGESSPGKYQGQASVPGYIVKWSEIPALRSQVAQGTTPLIFTYVSTDTTNRNGVTQADWERAAAKSGMGVQDTKNSFGPDAYKGPDGKLRVCTIKAARDGICKSGTTLSLSKRINLAEKVLATDAKCRWAGFNRTYHSKVSYQLGAEAQTLHVAAVCS